MRPARAKTALNAVAPRRLAAARGLQQALRIGHPLAGLGFHAQIQDVLDLAIQHVLGQAVIGNAVAQHAAQVRLRLKQSDAVSLQGQVGRHGQARRAAPNDGHLGIELRGGCFRGRILFGVRVDVIGHEALQIADRDGLVDLAAVAAILAGMLAHAPAGRRERAALADEIVGLFELARRHQGHVALRVHAGRAGGFAGRRSRRLWKCRKHWEWPAGRDGKWPCASPGCGRIRSAG